MISNFFAKALGQEEASTPSTFAAKERERPDIGLPVENGIVRYFSVSALQAADPNTYAGCLRRYWWKYVARKKEPEGKSQKEGKDCHAEAEHYLKTGEDVLGPVMRAGKHLMPRPGDDLIIEGDFSSVENLNQAIHLRLKSLAQDVPWRMQAEKEVEKLAGLCAAGVPLLGFIDVQHARGEYVNAAGALRKEDERHGHVVENIDHKTTSQIGDRMERGELKRGFAKSPEDLAHAIQMNGYGKFRINRDPTIDHVRSTHINYQTRGAREAKLVTILVSKEHIEKEWEKVSALAREIIHVAREERADLVPATPASCNSFRVGCPHRDYCPSAGRDSLIIDILGRPYQEGERENMPSIFDKLKKTETQTTQTTETKLAPAKSIFEKFSSSTETKVEEKPVNGHPGAIKAEDPARRAEIEAEKKRLLEEDEARENSVKAIDKIQNTYSATQGERIPVTACDFEEFYFVADENGVSQKAQFRGASKGKYFFDDVSGKRTTVETEAYVYTVVNADFSEPQNIGAVLPPDAPKHDFRTASAPLPASEIAEIEDPEIRARAEARAALEVAPVTKIVEKPVEKPDAVDDEESESKESSGGGRCPEGKKRVVLTEAQLHERRMVCSGCGKTNKIKPAKDPDGVYRATMPGHNVPKAATEKPSETVIEMTQKPKVEKIEISVDVMRETVKALGGEMKESGTFAEPILGRAILAEPEKTKNFSEGSDVEFRVEPKTEPKPEVKPETKKPTTIFVGVSFSADPPTALEDYYEPLLSTLEKSYGVDDVRFVPSKDNPLAYGAWRGALSVLVRSRPPVPGEYAVRAPGEVADVVVEALARQGARIVRGMR